MYFNKDLDLPIVSETNIDIYPNLQLPAKNKFLIRWEIPRMMLELWYSTLKIALLN